MYIHTYIHTYIMYIHMHSTNIYSWTGYTFPKSVPTDFLALRSPLDKLIEQGDY